MSVWHGCLNAADNFLAVIAPAVVSLELYVIMVSWMVGRQLCIPFHQTTWQSYLCMTWLALKWRGHVPQTFAAVALYHATLGLVALQNTTAKHFG